MIRRFSLVGGWAVSLEPDENGDYVWFDDLEAHDDEIRRECAEKQSQAFRVLATVLKDLKDDWRVVGGAESIQYLRAENAERVAREAAIMGKEALK